MHSRLRKDGGMTMIELLVAIMILGIFMGIAVPGIIKSFQAMDQAKRLTARYPKSHKALEQMSRMLRQTYPTALSAESPFAGRSDSIEAGGVKLPFDDITFPVLDTKYAHVRSAQTISYRLELNPSEEDSPKGLVQTRSFLATDSTTVIKETILERIVGLDFSYLDDSVDPPRWENEWPPPVTEDGAAPQSEEVAVKIEGAIRVPAAVKMTIFVPGEISPKPRSFTTVVNIPAR
jgi:prepilin-type N-terminal cleavage/methylation domain-containing protein